MIQTEAPHQSVSTSYTAAHPETQRNPREGKERGEGISKGYTPWFILLLSPEVVRRTGGSWETQHCHQLPLGRAAADGMRHVEHTRMALAVLFAGTTAMSLLVGEFGLPQLM